MMSLFHVAKLDLYYPVKCSINDCVQYVMLQDDDEKGLLGGFTSCGFGPVGPSTWPNSAVALISASHALHPDAGNGCGVCIEVSNRGSI